MNGIRFGNHHTYDDWGLILVRKKIELPELKTTQIEVEGGDGSLDLSEFFGEIRYSNRVLTFEFAKGDQTQAAFIRLISTISNAIHGQKLRVVIDDDPGFFYYGRVTISNNETEKNIGRLTVTVDADPWKYNLTETVAAYDVSGTMPITLANSRKRTVPEVITTAQMTIRFNNITYSVNAGSYVFPSLELVEGDNVITVTGTGNITFRYQEGRL